MWIVEAVKQCIRHRLKGSTALLVRADVSELLPAKKRRAATLGSLHLQCSGYLLPPQWTW